MLAGPISGLILLGRWGEAASRVDEAESFPGAAQLVIHLVAIDCWRGDLASARERLEQYSDLRDSEDMQARGGYTLHEAMVLRMEGKPGAGIETLEPLLARREELGVTFLIVKLSLVEAVEDAFDLGDAAKVDQLLGLIETLRPGERPPLLEAHAYRFRARQSGEEAGFATAEAKFRELEMPFWLALTQLEHSEWLIGESREDDAEPLLKEAREIFERLEARPYLERLDAALPAAARVPAETS